MKKRTKVIIATIAALVLVLIAWKAWPRSDPLAGLRKELANASPEDIMKRMRELPPEQRRELGPQLMEGRMKKDAEDYFKQPPDKRREYLDKKIKDMEKMRKEWEARRNQERQRGDGQEQGQGQGQGGQDPNGGAGGSGGSGGQGGSGGPGGRRSPSAEQRSQWANRRLDNSSSLQRAQQTAYRQDLMARRAALGLPTGRGGR